ncbi:PREDICTED: SKI family transcriptional corepressor 1 [Nanorana parkeri]|uniref:SKI family transcriptional corepressor 1 n=1 Tax=Nanorana parkeri TaxID=125878 RepID=UPI0008541C1C|nr:PREDICTED: SKI family transcriptional corepressor 1 [Nanorana parkeri]
MEGIGAQREPSSPATNKQDGQSFSGSLKPNQVGETCLYGVPIVSLVIDGQERLCLAQISNTLLKSYSYNEIHNRRVALGITCVQCTPVQLEILRRAGAMPISSRRCGMITKREAERLCKSFLGEHRPPKLPENFSFNVIHECAWGCRGSFIPARYNSSRAKCIKCGYCGLYFSPNKFIFHSHRTSDSKYTQPDAANFNSWRRHLRLSDSTSDDLAHSWEDVKAMFNGGTRKRAFSSPASGGSARQHLELAPPPPPPPAKSLRVSAGEEDQAARSFPLIPVPSKSFSGVLHKMSPPLFPPPPYGFPAFSLCAKKDDGLPDKALPGLFWPAAPTSKDTVYPPFPVFWPAAGALPVPPYPGLGQQQQQPAGAKCSAEADESEGGGEAEEPAREEDRSGDEARQGEPLTAGKLRYISAFRPVVKAAESLAKLYGAARPAGYSSPDLLSDASSYRSASPGPDTAEEVDVESERASNPAPPSTASSPARESEDRREHSPGRSPDSAKVYEVYAKQMAEMPPTMKGSTPHQSLATSYLCSLDPNEQDSEDSHSTAEDMESRKSFQDQRSNLSHASPLHIDRGEEDSPIDVTGTQFVEKDIENMAKDELQKLLMEQMDLRKKLEREFQSLKDNFQDQMKRELAYREEMVQQLQIVRDTLCNELDQERKARYAIQQKLKDADTKSLHRELFLQTSNPAPLSYIWAPRKLMYPPAP